MQIQAAFSFRFLTRFPSPSPASSPIDHPAINFSLESLSNRDKNNLCQINFQGENTYSHASSTQKLSRASSAVKCVLSGREIRYPMFASETSKAFLPTSRHLQNVKHQKSVSGPRGLRSNSFSLEKKVFSPNFSLKSSLSRSLSVPATKEDISLVSRNFFCRNHVNGSLNSLCGYNEILRLNESKTEQHTRNNSVVAQSGTKAIITEYTIIGMPGDGRCLFHSVTHGACKRRGFPVPTAKQREKLADELRNKVADEFIKRRVETEWFIEGDFDRYVKNIRKPHVWGGEPELLMMSHVLKSPISVFIKDPKGSKGVISIADYGESYGGDPIKVFYNGHSHYEALDVLDHEARSKL